MRSAPAVSVRLGLSVLKKGLAMRADPLGLLGAGSSDQLGVANRPVDAQMGGDGEIIHGANCGGLLRHLTRMLPHAKKFLGFARLQKVGGARYRRTYKNNRMRIAVNRFCGESAEFLASTHRLHGLMPPFATVR